MQARQRLIATTHVQAEVAVGLKVNFRPGVVAGNVGAMENRSAGKESVLI